MARDLRVGVEDSVQTFAEIGTSLSPSSLAETYLANMRQKRAKAYKKLMAMYELSFRFRQPYQVLGGSFVVSRTIERQEVDAWPTVDAGMCIASVDHKIEFVKQLATVLQGNVKPSA